MKTLTKVKIINWHYFWNETLEVKPIVFLTGLNGSGKSTLIDALQVVLLGDTTGRFFNKAAMDKSARTLKGYLRGELSDTMDGGFKYLRNGRFTSYIALEFFDTLKEKSFTMGIVFDIFESGDEEHRFFFLNAPIPENQFINDRIPMDYKTLSSYLKDNEIPHEFFDSNTKYKDFLKQQFGGLKDKYFSLLKKATSFSPITDITTFITQYVCDPQADIEVGLLQENIQNYKRLEEEAKVIAARIEKLEAIEENYNRYKENLETFKIAQYIVERCELEGAKDKLDAYKRQIQSAKDRLLAIDIEVSDFRQKLADLDKKKIRLIQDKSSNSVAKLTDELNEQKQDITKEMQEIERNARLVSNNLNNLCNSYLDAANSLTTNLANFDLTILDEDETEDIQELLTECNHIVKVCMDFRTTYVNDLPLLTKENLIEFGKELEPFRTKVASLAVSISRTCSQIMKKIETLQKEEASMKMGQKAYPAGLLTIKNRLEEELYNKYHKTIEVNIYCDLIDIRDLSWSDAIEGYLAPQKFNLFVAPKYYVDAYKILKEILREENFYGTALVDEERIIERNYQSEVGSLADEIKTTHDGARAYTNFLVGRLYKAKDVNDARQSGNGITKECDLYRNFSLSKISPRLYAQSYIGSNVDARFFEDKERQVKANQSNLNIFRKLNEIVSKATSLEALSSGNIENIFMLISKVSTLEGLKKSLDYIEEQLKQHDTTLLNSLDKRIAETEKEIESVNKKIEESLIEKGNLNKEIESLKNEKIVNEEENIRTIQDRLANSYDYNLVNEEASPLYEQRRAEGNTNIEILRDFQAQLSKLQYLVNNNTQALQRLRREYCSDYHLSFAIDAENNDQFDVELHDFKDVRLPEYQQKIEDSYHKATQQFRDDFINKLRGAIEDAEDQIENLNQALIESQFGRDSYRFTVTPSSTYRRYYDMLKDDIVLTSGQDETLFLEKYKDVMEDLFKQIVDTGDKNKASELSLNVQKFTDYRSYLDFDLVVYNNDTGVQERLSQMIRKKSGGETQTPFYIAVLASFAQLYHVNDAGELGNTTRIIIFDEAFSKMDKGRIKEAVRLLRKFDLQVILSAPSDKVGDISELVDETLVVLHEKNSSFVKLYAQDKLN